MKAGVEVAAENGDDQVEVEMDTGAETVAVELGIGTDVEVEIGTENAEDDVGNESKE